MKTVWRVLTYLKRYPWFAAGTLGCAIAGTLMVIVFPAVTRWIINDVVRANHPEKLLPLILLAAVAFLLQHGFNALRIVLNNTFEQKVIFDLRSDLYSHIQLLLAGALTYTLTAHRRYRLQRRAASAMNALLHDNLSGVRQIKSFVREK